MFDSTGKGCWKIFIIIKEEVTNNNAFTTLKPKAKKAAAKVKKEEFLPLPDIRLKIKEEPLNIQQKRSRT